MAEDALNTGTKVCAANRDAAAFHDGVEELVDVEEISEEENMPKRLLGFKEPKVAGTEWSVLFEVRISSTVYGAVAECQVWITARSVLRRTTKEVKTLEKVRRTS